MTKYPSLGEDTPELELFIDITVLVLFLLNKLDGLPPERTDLNLGAIVEDSINMDPEGFVKDLQARAGPTSDFATIAADDIAVETFVVPDGADLSEIRPATRNPTKQPTSASTIVPQNTTRDTLVICIVVTAGITAILLAFLCFYKGLFRAEGGQGTEKEAAWYSTGIVLLVSLLVAIIVLVIFLLV